MARRIQLSEDAYERLNALQKEGESLDDLIRRLTAIPLLRQMAGTMDEETAAHYRTVIRAGRERQDRELG